jgi:hypothetical protein
MPIDYRSYGGGDGTGGGTGSTDPPAGSTAGDGEEEPTTDATDLFSSSFTQMYIRWVRELPNPTPSPPHPTPSRPGAHISHIRWGWGGGGSASLWLATFTM